MRAKIRLGEWTLLAACMILAAIAAVLALDLLLEISVPQWGA